MNAWHEIIVVLRGPSLLMGCASNPYAYTGAALGGGVGGEVTRQDQPSQPGDNRPNYGDNYPPGDPNYGSNQPDNSYYYTQSPPFPQYGYRQPPMAYTLYYHN